MAVIGRGPGDVLAAEKLRRMFKASFAAEWFDK